MGPVNDGSRNLTWIIWLIIKKVGHILQGQMLPMSDMEKVQKFLIAEFLGFIISAKKCVILNMSRAMEKCKIVVYFENYTLETSSIDHWTFHSTGHL